MGPTKPLVTIRLLPLADASLCGLEIAFKFTPRPALIAPEWRQSNADTVFPSWLQPLGGSLGHLFPWLSLLKFYCSFISLVATDIMELPAFLNCLPPISLLFLTLRYAIFHTLFQIKSVPSGRAVQLFVHKSCLSLWAKPKWHSLLCKRAPLVYCLAFPSIQALLYKQGGGDGVPMFWTCHSGDRASAPKWL